MGDSVSTKVEGLTRSNDQKLELLRSGMEHRLDCFAAKSGRKIHGLTQSVAGASGKLQGEVSAKLVEFKNSLEVTVKETHQLQREQTGVIETKLSSLGQQPSQTLADVETTLRSHAQQLREETGASFRGLGDSLLTTLTEISQLQKNELQELRLTVDGRLATIQAENEKK